MTGKQKSKVKNPINLEISEGVFSGSLLSFNLLRMGVCDAMGGSFPPHKSSAPVTGDVPPLDDSEFYWGPGYSPETHPGLDILLNWADFNGKIRPEDCKKIVVDLMNLEPEIRKTCAASAFAGPTIRRVFEKFLDGLRGAVKLERTIVFKLEKGN